MACDSLRDAGPFACCEDPIKTRDLTSLPADCGDPTTRGIRPKPYRPPKIRPVQYRMLPYWSSNQLQIEIEKRGKIGDLIGEVRVHEGTLIRDIVLCPEMRSSAISGVEARSGADLGARTRVGIVHVGRTKFGADPGERSKTDGNPGSGTRDASLGEGRCSGADLGARMSSGVMNSTTHGVETYSALGVELKIDDAGVVKRPGASLPTRSGVAPGKVASDAGPCVEMNSGTTIGARMKIGSDTAGGRLVGPSEDPAICL